MTSLAWWADAQTFHISAFAILAGENEMFDWDTLAQSRETVTTHCPIDRGFFERCHALGVHCFPYVIFYMGPTEVFFGTSPGPVISSTTYEGVDFGSHPEFYELDQNNQRRIWAFGNATDGVGMRLSQPVWLVCPNLQTYQDKMIAWVDYIMSLGADGVFVDVVRRRLHCYAPHPHILPADPADPDAAQNQAFALLLKRVRQVVKHHRPDGLVLGNSGDPLNLTGQWTLPEFEQHLDSDTYENYICDGTGRTSHYLNNPSLPTWDELAQLMQPYLATGKQILVISNILGRDDAFFCYANARLAGFIWNCGVLGPLGTAYPGCIDLSRVQLGKPVTGRLTDPSGVLYRVFEAGLVAVNWDPQNERTLTVQPPIPGTVFFDLYPWSNLNFNAAILNEQILDVTTLGGVLTLPAESGRVYLFASGTDYGLNRLT